MGKTTSKHAMNWTMLIYVGCYSCLLLWLQRGGYSARLQADGRLFTQACRSRGILQEIREQKVLERYAIPGY